MAKCCFTIIPQSIKKTVNFLSVVLFVLIFNVTLSLPIDAEVAENRKITDFIKSSLVKEEIYLREYSNDSFTPSSNQIARHHRKNCFDVENINYTVFSKLVNKRLFLVKFHDFEYEVKIHSTNFSRYFISTYPFYIYRSSNNSYIILNNTKDSQKAIKLFNTMARENSIAINEQNILPYINAFLLLTKYYKSRHDPVILANAKSKQKILSLSKFQYVENELKKTLDESGYPLVLKVDDKSKLKKNWKGAYYLELIRKIFFRSELMLHRVSIFCSILRA